MNRDTQVDVQRPKPLGSGCCFIQDTGKPTLTEKSLQGAQSGNKVEINFPWKPSPVSPRGGAWRLLWGRFGAVPPREGSGRTPWGACREQELLPALVETAQP